MPGLEAFETSARIVHEKPQVRTPKIVNGCTLTSHPTAHLRLVETVISAKDLLRRRAPPNIQNNLEDFYRILQVDSKADPDVIRAAYRVLAQKNHPDRNPSPDAANAMGRLNGAYEILGDPARRRKYDGARVTGMDSMTPAGYDAHFAEQAAYQAEAAHPTVRRGPHRPAGMLGVRTFRQSRAGKAGLWLGICVGILVLSMLISGVNWDFSDLAYLLVTKLWVALMVFLILWGLVWSIGDLLSQGYLNRGKAEPHDS